MWGRKRERVEKAVPSPEQAQTLHDALRVARVEAAERTGVVVDLRDAEMARLELLNEALDPVFAEIPPDVELFDRGISRGAVPRLWVDAIAHVSMGHDKRVYRFLQDTRNGRKVLAESSDSGEIARVVTHYVASRLIERERALEIDERPGLRDTAEARLLRRRRRWRAFKAGMIGFLLGAAALFVALWVAAERLH